MYLFACVKDVTKLDEMVEAIKKIKNVVNCGKLFSEDETNRLIWILPKKDSYPQSVMEDILKDVPGIISIHPQGEQGQIHKIAEGEEQTT